MSQFRGQEVECNGQWELNEKGNANDRFVSLFSAWKPKMLNVKLTRKPFPVKT